MRHSFLTSVSGLFLLVAVATNPTNANASSYVLVTNQPVVDGVISPGEWSGIEWMALDKAYDGTTPDLTNAQWAAVWNKLDNSVYVVATGTDTSHMLTSYLNWNGQDCIEFYIDARNGNAANFDSSYELAQQYVVGYNEALTHLWVLLGNPPEVTGTPLSLPEVAFTRDGDTYTYEARMRPFDHLYKNFPETSTEIRLRNNLVIGLDCVMNSRNSEGNFGMLCENLMGGKFYMAAGMRDFTLTGDTGGSLLAIQ